MNNEFRKTFIVISLCTAFVFESFMFVYSKTLQRSADDLVKIQAAKPVEIDSYAKAKQCQIDGGKPVYYLDPADKFEHCEFDKK